MPTSSACPAQTRPSPSPTARPPAGDLGPGALPGTGPRLRPASERGAAPRAWVFLGSGRGQSRGFREQISSPGEPARLP